MMWERICFVLQLTDSESKSLVHAMSHLTSQECFGGEKKQGRRHKVSADTLFHPFLSPRLKY